MDSMVPVLCTMTRVVFGLELNGAFEEPGPKDVIRPGYTYVSGRKVNTTAPKPSSNVSICHSSLIFFCYEQQPYLWLFVLTLGTSYVRERRGWVNWDGYWVYHIHNNSFCSDKYEPALLRESHECKIEYQMDLFYLWFLLHFQYLDGPKWTIQRGGLHGSPLSNNDFTRFSVCDTA